MMLPEEDRQALKKNGYQITAKGVMPIAHPLQTNNSKSSSSAAQHRQGERDSSNNPRPIQSKATPNLRGMSPDGAETWSAGSSPKPKPKSISTALNTRRYGSADAEERRHAGFNLKPKPKPTSTPIASNTRHYGSADAEERRHAGSSLKPKPIPGSAGDLPEARKALQQTSNSYQNLKKLNKGRVFDGELRDLQRETSVAEARVNASEAAKKLQDSPTQARSLKSNNRGITEELRSDRVQQANTAKERYMGTLGLDNRGQPIKLTPPPPLAPQQSKPEPEKSWLDRARDAVTEKASNAWDKTKSVGNYAKDHASGIGHIGLDVGGMIPVAGVAFNGANAAWYLAEGDKVNAGISGASALASLVGGGSAVMVAKYGAKGANLVAKLEKTASLADRAMNVAGVAEGGINSVQYAREGDWKNAALALGSTFAGGVNTPRVPRRPGTVANVTGDAGDAVSSLGRGAKPVNPGAREVNKPVGASGTDGISRGQSSPVVRRPTDERGDVWRSSYLQKGGAKTSDPASKKARGEFRKEMNEAIAERIAIHRQRTGTPHPEFEGGKVGNYDQVTGKFTLRSDLEAGHTTTIKDGGREIFAIEARPFNQATSSQEKGGTVFSKRAMEIDGIPFQNQTVRELFPHLAENAPSVPGFTTSVKINGRGVEVAGNRLSDEQTLRLRQIATGEEKLDRKVKEDRELYRAYRQALNDSRPSRQQK